MKKTLNLGAFEALDHQEMLDVDGGTGPVIGQKIAAKVVAAIAVTTVKIIQKIRS